MWRLVFITLTGPHLMYWIRSGPHTVLWKELFILFHVVVPLPFLQFQSQEHRVRGCVWVCVWVCVCVCVWVWVWGWQQKERDSFPHPQHQEFTSSVTQHHNRTLS